MTISIFSGGTPRDLTPGADYEVPEFDLGGTEAIASCAPPLGLVEQSQFAETILELNPGDAFTLYTDGLFGAAKNSRPRTTPTQLAGMINPFAASAEALLELMLKAAAPDAAESPRDDVAALVVRRSN